MLSGGDPITATGALASWVVPTLIGTSVAAPMLSTGLQMALAPDEKGPQLADTNKKALSSFARNMANEEDKLTQNPNNSFLLRPGGRPITFGTSPNSRLAQQNSMLLT